MPSGDNFLHWQKTIKDPRSTYGAKMASSGDPHKEGG